MKQRIQLDPKLTLNKIRKVFVLLAIFLGLVWLVWFVFFLFVLGWGSFVFENVCLFVSPP